MSRVYFTLMVAALLAIPAFAHADRSGHIAALSVIDENASLGSVADIYLEIKPGTGAVYIESLPLTKIDTQISTRLAKEAACARTTENCNDYDFFYIINVPSSVIGGPSAGGAISVLTYALLEELPLRNTTAMTGTIMSGGIIGPVGGVRAKVAGAAAAGYDTALVPAWDDNESGIPLEDRYNISVVRIRNLDEAIYYFTGQQPEPIEIVPPPDGYTAGMEQVSALLCEHARLLIESVDEPVAENSSLNISDQHARGTALRDAGAHYSAASLCFGASLQAQHALLENKSLASRRITLGQVIDERQQLEGALEGQPVETIADLEITLIITERLDDVRETVSRMDTSDPEPAQLAYAVERLETARAWYTLLGDIESKEIIATDAQLAISCKQKLEEAQERINYLSYIYPAFTSSLEDSLREAFTSAQRQQYSLCLLQASQAKAEANSLLTALYVPENEVGSVIAEKLLASERQLSKQTAAGTFPILGYSYNEYSEQLIDTEPYSALLYAEYSLELSTLDIYFPEKESRRRLVIDKQMLAVFVTGALLGGIAGVLFTSIFGSKKTSKKTQRPKSATPKRNAPGKKR